MAYPVYYVVEGDVLPHLFDTYAGSTGASVTATGLAVTDIEIYKDGGVTQRASDAGYTLLDTDGLDFDGITGIHGFSIDLADNTDAGFYSVGPWYHVVVSTITVDSQTVSFVACAFRIISATRGMAGTALPNAAADAAGGLVISDAGGLDADAQRADVAAILVDTGTDGVLLSDGTGAGQIDLSSGKVLIQGTIEQLDDVFSAAGELLALADGILTAAKIAAAAITAAKFAANAVDANALAADAVAEIQSGLATAAASTAIEADTQDIQNRLPAALTAGGNIKADSLAVNGSTAAAARLALTAANMIPFTVDNSAHTPTTTEFEADDITEATADHYNGRIIIWTSGALTGQATSIADYAKVGANGHFTVVAMTEAPANNDTGIIV